MVKNLPAILEKRVPSLGSEDPLEEEMATYSSIPAWRIPWTEEPGGLQSMGSQRIGHDSVTFTFRTKSHLLLEHRMLCLRTAALVERQRSFQAQFYQPLHHLGKVTCFPSWPNLHFIAGRGP